MCTFKVKPGPPLPIWAYSQSPAKGQPQPRRQDPDTQMLMHSVYCVNNSYTAIAGKPAQANLDVAITSPLQL